MKRKTIVLIALFIIIVGVGVGIWLLLPKEKALQEDRLRFAKEYQEVGEENVFVYRDAKEIVKILKNGTGVVYLGFPTCPWCQTYVTYLNEAAKEVGLEKIYYYNILEDREKSSKTYQEIVSLLKEHLQYDEEGNERIYVPNVSFHIDGKIIGNDFETSKDTAGITEPKDYWTKEKVKDLKERLKGYMEEVNAFMNMCTDCNK